jgi:hypothetical protein
VSQAGQDEEAPFGVLVGWEHVDLGERLLVKLQSTRSHPASEPDALDEWKELLAPFTAIATPAMMEGVSKMYSDMPNWGEGSPSPGFGPEVWAFVQAAGAARAASHGG